MGFFSTVLIILRLVYWMPIKEVHVRMTENDSLY